MREHARQSSNALRVGPTRRLAQDGLLAVGLAPSRCLTQPLLADGRRHTVFRCAGSVAVKVLVHLVDDLVTSAGRITQDEQVRAVAA